MFFKYACVSAVCVCTHVRVCIHVRMYNLMEKRGGLNTLEAEQSIVEERERKSSNKCSEERVSSKEESAAGPSQPIHHDQTAI